MENLFFVRLVTGENILAEAPEGVNVDRFTVLLRRPIVLVSNSRGGVGASGFPVQESVEVNCKHILLYGPLDNDHTTLYRSAVSGLTIPPQGLTVPGQ